MEAAGNEDEFTSIEVVTGGSGSDRLTGDAQGNAFRGGPGKDRLAGGGGDDDLEGGEGRDRIYGEDGRDFLLGGAGPDRHRGGDGADTLGWPERRGEVACGRGEDTVTNDYLGTPDLSRRDRVPRDCERVEVDADFVVIGPPRRIGRSTVRLRCALGPDFDPEPDGFPRISLFKSQRLLGRSRAIRRSGAVTVRLSRAGRRSARAGTTVVVRDDNSGTAYSVKMR
jgi:hypothetical protein